MIKKRNKNYDFGNNFVEIEKNINDFGHISMFTNSTTQSLKIVFMEKTNDAKWLFLKNKMHEKSFIQIKKQN